MNVITNKVYISSSFLDSDDIDKLNQDIGQNIRYDLFVEHGLIDPGVVHIIFELLQDIGYNAVYDIVKKCILKVMHCLGNKEVTNYTLQVEANSISVIIKCTHEFTSAQENEIIESIIEKALAQKHKK